MYCHLLLGQILHPLQNILYLGLFLDRFLTSKGPEKLQNGVQIDKKQLQIKAHDPKAFLSSKSTPICNYSSFCQVSTLSRMGPGLAHREHGTIKSPEQPWKGKKLMLLLGCHWALASRKHIQLCVPTCQQLPQKSCIINHSFIQKLCTKQLPHGRRCGRGGTVRRSTGRPCL